MLWASLFGRVLAWDDIGWLKSLTNLLILPGICHPMMS
jgi:lactate 2-monooxygenase